MWLEHVERPSKYYGNDQEWQVKPTEAKGADLAYAKLRLNNRHPVTMCDERFGFLGTNCIIIMLSFLLVFCLALSFHWLFHLQLKNTHLEKTFEALMMAMSNGT
jgi:hypothetical protein